MRKDFIPPKLVAALDRCRLGMRDSVFILEATVDALGCNIDEFPIKKSIDDFISVKSQSLFSRLKIDDSFLNEIPSSWANNVSFLNAKKTVSMLRAVNDTAETAVKMMQDFHGLITVEEEQKQFLLRCVQEHMKIYTDSKQQTLKRKYVQ
ncbi:hypothetical protein AVEN_57226-1 [Araneus ventricosus]|uniref:Uncharacterized protein n=1 Tax=Araneus ventricosus TaxID=182803 RepID=A0A4Y2JE21_ARAVE|nr:hypothetical protein AVEN_57226-1 [Araneus ventricosus]